MQNSKTFEAYNFLKVGLVNPRAWIAAQIEDQKPHMLCPELIDRLYSHFKDFLVNKEFDEFIEIGGVYNFFTITQGSPSYWKFVFSPCDYPGDGAFFYLLVDDPAHSSQMQSEEV